MASHAPRNRELGTVTVRVDRTTHARMVEIAEAERRNLTELVALAVDLYWRERMFEQADAAYAALRADPIANAAWEAEMALWDSTLMDGLENEPPYDLETDPRQGKDDA